MTNAGAALERKEQNTFLAGHVRSQAEALQTGLGTVRVSKTMALGSGPYNVNFTRTGTRSTLMMAKQIAEMVGREIKVPVPKLRMDREFLWPHHRHGWSFVTDLIRGS